jgi:hypothetical protein
MRYANFKLYFFIGFLALFAAKADAQSLQGFYNGELKVTGRNARLSMQLDLMEANGIYTAVLRSRIFENGVLTGCDNWLEGKLSSKGLQLNQMAVVKETGLPPGTCGQLNELRMTVNTTKGEPELTGTWIDSDDVVFGKFTLKRIDTANSFSVPEEKEIALRYINEGKILMAPTMGQRIMLMLATRPTDWIDSLTVPTGDASIKFEAKEADPFHKLTVLIDSTPVIVSVSPRKQVNIVTLDSMKAGEIRVLLLCDHAMVDVMYNVTVTLVWQGQQHQWIVPVSTFKNRGIIIRFKNPEG